MNFKIAIKGAKRGKSAFKNGTIRVIKDITRFTYSVSVNVGIKGHSDKVAILNRTEY